MIIFCASSVHVNGNPSNDFDEVYITVKNSNTRLQQFFELIQSQTSFVFAYDENEVNLSHKLKLTTGKQPLSELLNIISVQTGLQFTQTKSTILVSRKTVALQTIEENKKTSPVKGTVRDASGNPLGGATVSVKGTKNSVQTDAAGNFSVVALENDVLIVSYVGYKSQEIAVNGRALLEVNIEELE